MKKEIQKEKKEDARENKKTKNKLKKYKPGPEVQIRIYNWNKYKKFQFLKEKTEEELIRIIKESNVGALQREAIKEIANRAAERPSSIELFDSYIIILKYSDNKTARENLIKNINKPIFLEWVIRNCPYEDTREIAKKRLSEILSRPKV
ncbi:MAG: hypothetical protein QXZ30_02545 [Candidatus Bilamarchaeaceae archaeon]